MKYHWKKLTSLLVAAILAFNMAGQSVVGFASNPKVPDGSIVADETIPANPNASTEALDGEEEATTQPEGEPTTKPEGESEPTTEPEGEGEPTTEPEGEGEPTTKPEGEGEPTTKPEGEGEPTTKPEGEGESTTKPEGEGEPTTKPEGEGEPTTKPEGEGEQVTTPDIKTITQITLPEAALNAALNTAQENLQLPNVLTVLVEGQAEPVEVAVTWICDNYNAALSGSYIFTAQLAEGYVLAEGISLPQVTVTVGNATGEVFSIWSEPVFVSSFQEPEPYDISLFSTGTYSGSYKAQLTERGKLFYDAILKNPTKTDMETDPILLSIEINGKIEGNTFIPDDSSKAIIDELNHDFSQAAYSVCYDHPEYSWILTGGFEYSYNISYVDSQPRKYTINKYSFRMSSVPDFASKMSAMYSKINEIVSGAPSGSLQETLKYFHDTICRLTSYNHDAAALDKPNAEWLYAWSPYGTLTGKQVVCEGYARAFKMLCDAANIPCALIGGIGNTGAHMWNAVQMDDGNWYGVDVTWDDQDRISQIRDEWFLKHSGEFSKHEPIPHYDLVYPVLSDTPYTQPEPSTSMTVTSDATSEWSSKDVTFTVTVDNFAEGISCVYTLNDGEETPIELSEGKGTVTVDTEGEHTLTFTLKKDGSAVEGETQTLSAKIDKTDPIVSNVTVEATETPLSRAVTTNKQVKISATVTDAVSGVASVTAKIGDTSVTMEKDSSGDTYSYILDKEVNDAEVSVTATDNAENESAPVNANDTITTDKTAPVINSLTASEIKDVTAAVNVTADSDSKIYYLSMTNNTSSADEVINNNTFIEVTAGTQGTITLNNLTANTTYTVYAVAVDTAGNRSEMKSVSFTTTQTQLTFKGTLSASGIYGVTWDELTISVSEGGKVTANGEEVAGTWSWSNPSAEKPQAGNTTAQATFTPDNASGYAQLTADVSIEIEKAAANVVTNPADQTIKADNEKNTADALKAMLPATVTVTAQNNVSEELGVTWSTTDGFDAKGGTYTYTGTLADSENVSANGKTAAAKITVEAVNAALPTIAPISVKYTGVSNETPENITAVPKSGSVTVTGDKETTVNYTISWTGTVDLTQEQVGQPAQTINGTVAFTDAPEWLTLPSSLAVTQEITVVNKDVATVTVTTKDNLVYDGKLVEESDFNVQTALNARNIPEMTFKYYQENNEISAPKDAGTYSVQVTYETATHYGQSDAVEFTIQPKTITLNEGNIHFEKTYDGNAETTGITPTGALGVDGVIDPDTVTVSYTKATFDSEKVGKRNINFSGITLDNPNYKLENDAFSASGVGTINKADASAEVPTGLTALTNLQKTLADVALPEGWAWKTPATTLTASDENKNPTFPAIFTPTDTENYQPIEKEVSVAVSEITFTGGNAPVELEVGESVALSHNAYVTGAEYNIPAGEYRADRSNVVSIEGSMVTGKAVGTATISWIININGQELSFEIGKTKVLSKQPVQPDVTIPSVSNPVVSTEIPDSITEPYWKVEEGDDASKVFPALPAGAQQQFLLIGLYSNGAKVTLENPISIRVLVPNGFNSSLKFQVYRYHTTQIQAENANAVLKTAEDGTQYLEFMFDNTADIYSIQYNIPNAPVPPTPNPQPAPEGDNRPGSGNSGNSHNSSSDDDDWSSSSEDRSESDTDSSKTLFGRLKSKLTSKPDSKDSKTTTVKAKAKMSISDKIISAKVPEKTLEDAVTKALKDSKKNKTSPVVQVTLDTEKNVHTLHVTLPTESLNKLAKDSDAKLTLTSPVATVEFDAKALKAICKQAGKSVTLKVIPVDTSTLTAEQQAVVGDRPVVELLLVSDEEYISDFKGGNVRVSLPYQLRDGEKSKGLVVYFMDQDAKLYECKTSYSTKDKLVTFTTPHFSKYMVGYDTDKVSVRTAQTTTSSTTTSHSASFHSDKYNPTTGSSNMVSIMALAATLSFGGLVALGRKKR